MTTPETTAFGSTVVPVEYAHQVTVSAARWGIPRAILAAQIRYESDFRPAWVGSQGYAGIAQLSPDVAHQLGVDPYNPVAAIDALAQLDRQYLDQTGNNYPLALAAVKLGAVPADPPDAGTQRYVQNVLLAAGSVPDAAGMADVLTDDPQPVDKSVDYRRLALWVGAFVLVFVGFYLTMEKRPGGFKPALRIEGNIP